MIVYPSLERVEIFGISSRESLQSLDIGSIRRSILSMSGMIKDSRVSKEGSFGMHESGEDLILEPVALDVGLIEERVAVCVARRQSFVADVDPGLAEKGLVVFLAENREEGPLGSNIGEIIIRTNHGSNKMITLRKSKKISEGKTKKQTNRRKKKKDN